MSSEAQPRGEQARVEVVCVECNTTFRPYGFKIMSLPWVDTVTCPNCKHEGEYYLLDSETKKKHLLTRLDKSNNRTREEVKDLEKRIVILEKENSLLRGRNDLTEEKLEKIELWAKEKEQAFKEIELFLEEEREKNEYRQNNK